MDNKLSFNEFYSLMSVCGMIIIEDKIQCEKSRSAVIYDYLRMSTHEQELFLDSIKEKTEIASLLKKIAKEYQEIKENFDWEEVPPRDIEVYLNKRALNTISDEVKKLTDEDIEMIHNQSVRFGMGLKVEALNSYKGLLEGIYEKDERMPIRIYKEYATEDWVNIQNDIDEFSGNNKYFICVIDDFLNDQPMGDQIIKDLNSIDKAKEHGICLMLSSRERKPLEVSHNSIYAEYIIKENKQLEENIKRALIKSQYSIMLQILKKKRNEALEITFDYALDNIDIAVYLSSMASEEGVTNYEVITNWLELREGYNWYDKNKLELKSMVMLSSLLNTLADEKFEVDYSTKEIEGLQVFEKYDYSVNSFNIPPMSGDIFCINNKYYLLIGQECDLSIRNGKRKNSIAELLPIRMITNHDMGKYKEKYDYEKLLLGSFKTVQGAITNIEIDCTKREIIDSEILDFCAFSNDGESKINIAKDLTLEQKCMLPLEWQQYYENIKKRMDKLLRIKESVSKNSETLEFGFNDILVSMGASHNDRLVSIVEFDNNETEISYAVKRVCRIKNHILLANKLYLEYRGRQAFNTINMDVGRISQYILEFEGTEYKKDGNEAILILTNKRRDNEGGKLKRRDWIIFKKDILEFLSTFLNNDSEKYIKFMKKEEEEILLVDLQGTIGEGSIGFTKQIKEEDKLILKLKLLK